MGTQNPLEGEALARIFDTDSHVYALLDAASIPELLDQLYGSRPPFACLYPGDLAPEMAYVAPYAVRFEKGHPFTDWALQNWGDHWGVFLHSEAQLDPLTRHLRQFVIVHDERGRPLYFRFYDPRVLPVYLRTCNPGELAQFFGPIAAYLSESRDGFSVFRLDAGKLRRDLVAKAPAQGGAGS